VLRVPLHQDNPREAEALNTELRDSVTEAIFGAGETGLEPTVTAHASNSLFSLNGRERNMLFLNQGSSFQRMGATSGADDITDGRSFVAFDFDDDGDLDVIVKNLQKRTLHVLRNDFDTQNHRVAFRLEGNSGNRDAIGARLVLRAGGKTRTKQVRSASGFLSQSPTEVFFGLKGAETIESLEVHWPRGETQVFTDLAADRRYRLEEGKAPQVLVEFPAENNRTLVADPYPAINDPPVGTTQVRPIPTVPADALNGPARAGFPAGDKPILVAFLTSWCHSCREDIALLTDLWAMPDRPFDIAVVQVIEPEFPERELNVADLPFPVFRGNRQMLLSWRNSLAFVVPTTFWVGQDRNIYATYTGRLDRRRVLVDLEALASGR
jgi:thiol-disulfide isomerase/thioredoxin